MTGTIVCKRCGAANPPLDHPPFNDDLGRRIEAEVCAACWQAWQDAQINVINEQRISLRDVKGRETLARHMKEFLKLED